MLGAVRGWTVLWFAYGLTTNMIEEPMMNMAIGVAFGTVFGVAVNTAVQRARAPAAAIGAYRRSPPCSKSRHRC